MVDTARTVTDLTTNLFQDSQTAGISAQDMRDLIKSFQVQHGGIYISTAASTVISVAGTYVKAGGTTTLFGDTANAFDMSTDNRLRYTGTPTRTVLVACSASLELDTAIVSKTIGLKLYKGGSAITGLAVTGYAPTVTAKTVNLTLFGFVELATNEYVEAFVANVDSTDDITVSQMTLIGLGLTK